MPKIQELSYKATARATAHAEIALRDHIAYDAMREAALLAAAYFAIAEGLSKTRIK